MARLKKKSASMKSGAGDTAVARTVRTLRDRSLAATDGDHLGSEVGLLKQLGISRPTFRQAVRLLEHEQLVITRKGIYGGLYARRPSVKTVTEAASLHLLGEHATLAHVLEVYAPLHEYAVRQAAHCKQARLRQDLRALAETMRTALAMPNRPSDLVHEDARYNEIIASMAGNPVLGLLLAVMNDFGGISLMTMRLFEGDAKRTNTWRRLRIDLVDSILAGNDKKASQLTRRSRDNMAGWIIGALGRRSLGRSVVSGAKPRAKTRAKAPARPARKARRTARAR
ncbi:MAG: FadR/GntR family transcriptional regulator [Gammaproteobacteria bacterium]